ncbi:hypothetical protein GN157_17020 [Flavobacterium rakeshii]|uniref:Tail specific protease domain-containing protein n=1 Tax=Flavobacterium rakeshii TaxID=1038845 RepID=A0A6N8HID2_9FLAO|nr:S41 family peptidase [Flavobacterium rakeshii]MUV05418.1 hypothetical protein [Flavobacterium rakeshii]
MKKLLFFILFITACSKTKNTTEGFSNLDLPKYSKTALEKDFLLLINSLKEAHTGLYWYNTPIKFDSIVQLQQSKLKDSLNSLEFYNIIAPIIAYTKEDHCDISLPPDASTYLTEKGKFIPINVIVLNKKTFILNNPHAKTNIKGWQLLEINGLKTEAIYRKIFQTFASDGFIEISKYRFMDMYRLSLEYAKTISQPDYFNIKVKNPDTGQEKQLVLKACNYKKLAEIRKKLKQESILKIPQEPASISINNNTALLTVNSFSSDNFEEAGISFETFIKDAFLKIEKSGVKNLIIDMRENGGGTEGNEDFLFSFLTNKPYNKYKYVQASAFSYSFYQYTDYNLEDDYKELEADLKEEHYKAEDGRILRKPGIQAIEPLKKNAFHGNIFILTSGWTYSGGAEFSSLMREHTNAIFIGEETGGCFYGNTSGYIFELTLPNTKTLIDIPILKFVLDVNKNIPQGRGVLPDYEVEPTIKEFLEGKDIPMEFTKKLILKTS